MPDFPPDLEALRSAYADCFGCGRGNAMGLRLDDFRVEAGDVVATFVPRPEYAGFEGTLHGGIVATALDEVSAWSAMLSHRVFVFTATLDLRYRRQAPSDAHFELRGTVAERRGRRLRIAASMNHDGVVVAESNGLFVVAEEVGAVLGRSQV